ncbi:hypothetical protein PSEUBRA_001756 [Kalmanozyma brasiliensis GHG001]|uniref:Uncharacterized protein n=1 Tax=Kalmanozyma brasiliensis (strain GHG001) TaxID=1365824 RepID=V5F0E9_KALBG|nr:uncharacterized protein PSEUBRA_001756 [Kalmanozyma brasiliensis GHG001]EST08679.1 hypothetical protein PSEUBRA_001756 [Kalmanozyma brasiliensis GHG001]
MSDRYQGSAFRGGRSSSYRDDRRYAPRHPRDDHYDSRAAYDARDPYASSYYPEPRGYPERPRRVHKTIPPPRPWDYSRRPPPRTDQERMELEREREAWEAKEEERFQQRMAERERERQRDWERSGGVGAYGAADGWGGREREADAYERRHAEMGRRPRSRSPPGADARYEQRGGWGRTAVAHPEESERDLAGVPADRVDAAAGYAVRRSPPPPAGPASHLDAPDGPSALRYRDAPIDRPLSPQGTPRGPARDPAFASTPPTGPRASRGAPPAYPSSAFRGRDASTSSGPFTPTSDREGNSYMSPSTARFPRSARDGAPPTGPYRGGHPFNRSRRDTNPYDYPPAEDDGYRAHPGSSPHESPSTPGPHTATRLSRTSSSQAPPTPTTLLPPGNTTALASPSTLAPSTTTPRFSSATHLTPDLDSELLALETQRSTFIANYVLGAKRASLRALKVELRDGELELAASNGRRSAAERALEIARETADSYSLEENRKEELMRVMSMQMEGGQVA